MFLEIGNRNKLITTLTTIFVTLYICSKRNFVTPSRQFLQGQKARKKNQQISRDTIGELTKRIKEIELENQQLREGEEESKVRIRVLEDEVRLRDEKLGECDNWVKMSLQLCSKATKTDFLSSARAGRANFPVGTNRRLRENIGLNLSNPNTVPTAEQNNLMKAVREFALEQSMEVPDKRRAAKGVRYRVHFLSVLHQWFMVGGGPSLAYSTFCEYWPTNIVRPGVADWGTCLVCCSLYTVQ